MKKYLLIMTLALVGGVCTSNAKIVYFADNWTKSGFKLYAWTGENKNAEFPGVDFPSAEDTRVDGYPVYKLDLGDYDNFVISYEDNGRVQSTDCLSSTYNEGDYFDISDWNGGTPTLTGPLNVYEYNLTVTTTDAWDHLYIHLWNPSTEVKIYDGTWPGKELTGSENVYTFRHYSFLPEIGLLFDKGDGLPQTSNLTAIPGDNNFCINVPSAKINDTWGITVKTNAFGYATFAPWNAVSIEGCTAYYAKDNGNGSATAYKVTNPKSNTPILLKGAANTTYHFAPTSDGEVLTYTNAFIKGSDTKVQSHPDDNHYNYILNGNIFKAANNQKVAWDKAYLQLSQAASASRILTFPDDEAAAVHAITAEQDNDSYYNLHGVKVAQPTKGLYIHNGKKLIVK